MAKEDEPTIESLVKRIEELEMMVKKLNTEINKRYSVKSREIPEAPIRVPGSLGDLHTSIGHTNKWTNRQL